MINPDHDLSLSRQAKALGISRSSIYYLPRPISEQDQLLMKRIDRLTSGNVRMLGAECYATCCAWKGLK